MVADNRRELFEREMNALLRGKFKKLAGKLNGHGRPTTAQLTACVMASAAEVQAKSPYFLTEPQFDEIIDPFKRTPFYGESVRPMYEEITNGNGHKEARGGESDV